MGICFRGTNGQSISTKCIPHTQFVIFCSRTSTKNTKNANESDTSVKQQVKSIAECSREHSAILSTFVKLPFVIKICLFLGSRFTQILMYLNISFEIICNLFHH